ncbi:hypothetical protein [Fusibacter sp. 3D3]|nr:hypothetical protein [Fusibacter sp. 3D3]GAU76720.1 hypothetical protein F3D3_1317 [Fusibacter sp. 3D3]
MAGAIIKPSWAVFMAILVLGIKLILQDTYFVCSGCGGMVK